nr:HAD hydrolase-like protein [uncultured Desulfobulbus sp.]
MHAPLTNLLFDLDGTLTDPKVGITRSIQHALEALGEEPPHADSLEWCIGPPLVHSFAELLQTNDTERIQEALHLYRERFSATGLYENAVYEGIPAMLEQLQQRGFQLFLATAKPRIFAERILQHFKLDHYFSLCFGAELDGRFTDKPSLIAHILEQTGVVPEETMMIGDRRYDLEGGQAHCLRTAAVTYGYGTRDELESVGADFFFDSPGEISSRLVTCFNSE